MSQYLLCKLPGAAPSSGFSGKSRWMKPICSFDILITFIPDMFQGSPVFRTPLFRITDLGADPCHGLTPVGIAVDFESTDLKSVARARSQPAYQRRWSGLCDRLLRPVYRCSPGTERRPA